MRPRPARVQIRTDVFVQCCALVAFASGGMISERCCSVAALGRDPLPPSFACDGLQRVAPPTRARFHVLPSPLLAPVVSLFPRVMCFLRPCLPLGSGNAGDGLPRKGVVQTLSSGGWSWIKKNGTGSRKSGNRIPFAMGDVAMKVTLALVCSVPSRAWGAAFGCVDLGGSALPGARRGA